MSQLSKIVTLAIKQLAAAPVGGYAEGGELASEPTAWGAIALDQAGQSAQALQAAQWLADRQTSAGSVGVTASQDDPAWTTALAMLAWQAIDGERYAIPIRRAAEWAFAQEPTTIPRHPIFGHDTTIQGWSWAPDTHSWLEPTTFYAVALRESGFADHPRRAEAVRLLVDRLLPDGGANYGNTVVFDQVMQQHVHSSGIVAWALAGERIYDPRIEHTLDYLQRAIQEPTGLASLAWAARGLAAHHRADETTIAMLAKAWPRAEQSRSHHKIALFALAAQEVLVGRSKRIAVGQASR